MFITLGCEFTLANFWLGALGGLVAVLVLPGSYTTIPRLVVGSAGDRRICWGALARLVVAGIGGCVVDCSHRNTFFGGFFSWHAFTWLSGDGWSLLRDYLRGLAKHR